MIGNICHRHLCQSLLSLASAETIYVRKWQPSIHPAIGNVPFVRSSKEQQQCENSDTIEFHPLTFRSRSIACAAWPSKYHLCETRKNRFSSLSMAQYNSINSRVRRINMSCATHEHTNTHIGEIHWEKMWSEKLALERMDTDVVHRMHMCEHMRCDKVERINSFAFAISLFQCVPHVENKSPSPSSSLPPNVFYLTFIYLFAAHHSCNDNIGFELQSGQTTKLMDGQSRVSRTIHCTTNTYSHRIYIVIAFRTLSNSLSSHFSGTSEDTLFSGLLLCVDKPICEHMFFSVSKYFTWRRKWLLSFIPQFFIRHGDSNDDTTLDVSFEVWLVDHYRGRGLVAWCLLPYTHTHGQRTNSDTQCFCEVDEHRHSATKLR